MLNEQISYEKLMYFLIEFYERYFEKYKTNKSEYRTEKWKEKLIEELRL